MTIPRDHLRACPDHRLVDDRDHACPACTTGVEARPDEFMEESRPPEPLDLQWHIEGETMQELLPLMETYLDDRDQGPLWVSVAELPEDLLPAGYTRQERWFNVVRYRWGARVKTMMHDESARETIETLRDEGYG